MEPYNDLKLNDSGVRRGTCMVGGKAATEAGKVFLERSYLVLAQLEQAIEKHIWELADGIYIQFSHFLLTQFHDSLFLSRFTSSGVYIIPVPGHTKGQTALLYKNKFLFTGDHLAWSESLHQLTAFYGVCWYSWSEQTKSMRNLANYSFEWVLPGHGRRFHADKETMRQQMHKCIEWMESLN